MSGQLYVNEHERPQEFKTHLELQGNLFGADTQQTP